MSDPGRARSGSSIPSCGLAEEWSHVGGPGEVGGSGCGRVWVLTSRSTGWSLDRRARGPGGRPRQVSADCTAAHKYVPIVSF